MTTVPSSLPPFSCCRRNRPPLDGIKTWRLAKRCQSHRPPFSPAGRSRPLPRNPFCSPDPPYPRCAIRAKFDQPFLRRAQLATSSILDKRETATRKQERAASPFRKGGAAAMGSIGGAMEAASQPSILLFFAAFLMGILGISVCEKILTPPLPPPSSMIMGSKCPRARQYQKRGAGKPIMGMNCREASFFARVRRRSTSATQLKSDEYLSPQNLARW